MEIVNVCAPQHWDYLDSYGLIACQLARHITALGVRVNALGLGKTVLDSQPPDVRAVTTQPYRRAQGAVYLGYPTNYHHHNRETQTGPRVAITMWESSVCPATWPPILNTLDAVIVPSQFCRTMFRNCGVTVPIHVIPLGIGEAYQYAERPADRPLTFLAFLDRGARKGGLVALQAFLMAFGDDMRYRLILKGRNPKVRVNLTNPNIDIIQQDMTEQELCQLYQSADVFVNANRGEGFGLLPREAGKTGCVSLATDWGGTADDLDAWGWTLPYTLTKANWQGTKFEGLDLGDWAEPDMDGVVARLKDVAKYRGIYQSQARIKAQAVAELYSWRRFAEQVLDVYREVAGGRRERLRAA